MELRPDQLAAQVGNQPLQSAYLVAGPETLHVLEAAAHGAFAGTSPEEAELDAEIRLFCEHRWRGG